MNRNFLARWTALAALLLLLALAPAAGAQTLCDSDPGRIADMQDRAQLKRFVHCAVDHIDAVGWEQATADFQSSRDWLDGGMYLFAGTEGGTLLFSAGSGLEPGSDMWELQDSDGYYISQNLERIALNHGGGWLYYHFVNRDTGLEEPKVAYITRIDLDGEFAVLGAGLHPLAAHGTCPADRVRAALVYSEQDVERFVTCAAHRLQQQGLTALAEFNSDPRWVAGPTYLFMGDTESLHIVAHGGNADFIGQELGDLVDVDGVLMMQEFRRILRHHDEGHVYYTFANPATGAEERKASYVRRVPLDGRDYFLGAGLYLPAETCRDLPLARDIDTREELQQYVRCARLLVDERGEQAFELFLHHPQWIGGSTYIFVSSGVDCRNLVYPLDYRADDTLRCDIEDAAGNLLNQDIRDMAASEAGEGWVDYVWLNPANETVEPKHSYIIGTTLNDEPVSIGAGLYESELQ